MDHFNYNSSQNIPGVQLDLLLVIPYFSIFFLLTILVISFILLLELFILTISSLLLFWHEHLPIINYLLIDNFFYFKGNDGELCLEFDQIDRTMYSNRKLFNPY